MCSPLHAAEPPTTRDFNGPETTWQVVDDERMGRVLAHECAAGGARDNTGFERIVLAAPGGKSVQLICPTAPVAVIEELEVRIWVKANRPDIQLAARIALPRSATNDGKSGASVVVRGTKYDRPGHWQQLVLNNVPKRLAEQVRILRTTPGAKIDPREAFLDAVVLIVPCEPQGVEVATDDLVVDGVVRNVSEDIQLTAYPVPAVASPQPSAARSIPASLRRLPDATRSVAATDSVTAVQLQGDLLLVGNKPFVPRAIHFQGEPLQYLAEHGFNVVWLDRAPTAEQIAEAKKLGLWFISLPPHPEALARDGLGQPGDRVIAWYLDDAAIESDPTYARRWADLVRESDAVASRPVIIAPHDQWNAASKTADVLLASRSRLGLLSIADYDEWLVSRSQLVHPGTPIWANFTTQVDPVAGRQISALSGVTAAAPNIEARQLRSLVQIACTRGVRGFVFHSDSPLNETDPATRVRATNLELINRRVQRLEPWLASGKVIGRCPSSDAAWSGCLLYVDRAQLLIPMADPATPMSTAKEVTFVVPGVSESCRVFALSPVALKVVPIQRVAGGTRFVLRPEDDAFVLMTEDPKVVQSLRQHIARYGDRIVRLQRDGAALQAATIGETARRLTQNGINSTAAAQAATIANAQLHQVDAALASNRMEQAYQAATAANQILDQAAVELRRSVNAPTTPLSNPLALSDDRLAEFAGFERVHPTLQVGENLLYGGDFEDLGQLTQLGWRHFSDPNPGVESKAELSTAEPRHGSYCLMMHAAASVDSAQELRGTPVWIDSPPVPVTAGQVLEIAGWVRVDPPFGGGSDGLHIVDSLGGPDLTLAIRQTNGWERFRIIRAVPESTELRITFALTGLGTARLDAVMVRTLQQQQPARRLPVLAPANGTAANPAPAAAAGPLFGTPPPR